MKAPKNYRSELRNEYLPAPENENAITDLSELAAMLGHEPDTAEQAKLAAKFAEVLHEWLSPADMREVVARNLSSDYDNACASHDFCDANMAMDEAFTKTQGREIELGEGTRQSRADVALWNGAWAIAKRMNFDMVLLNHYATTSF